MSFGSYSLTAEIFDKRGRRISSGKNFYQKSHPFQAKCAKRAGKEDAIYLHAEIHAIVKCKNLTDAYKIRVERFDKNGNPMIAKPCPICQIAIQEAGIEIVEHT